MHDRRDRTSWAYQVPNLAPPIPYAESSGIPACHPPPSSHMLSTPSAHSLLPSLQYHQQSSHRFLTSPAHSATFLASFRCSSTHDCTNEQNCPQQHQYHRHQEHISRPLAPLPPSFTMMTETWFGLVQTPRDAYLLLEACRVGMLHRITRRLTDLERSQIIRPGAIFVWEEKEAGIKRWTDHVRWSPSRVSGAFLIYSELLSASSRESHAHPSDPLLKQSFSPTTLEGDRLHLIAYYSKSSLDSGQLPTPSVDDRLRSIVVPPGVYPDHRATIVEDQSSRDRTRSILLPRSSVGSFETSYSVLSSHSLDSTASSLDRPHLHPGSPTHLGEVSCDRPYLSVTSHPDPTRSFSSGKASTQFPYGSQQSYHGSSLYPLVSRLSENPAPPSEATRWDTLPSNISNWEPDAANAAETSETIMCASAQPPATTSAGSAFTSPNLPSLTSLGAWKGEQEREKIDKRLPAHTTQSTATHNSSMGSSNNHNYHPYARISDRERVAKERRMDARPRDSRAFAYDSTTAPVTPLTRVYTIPPQQEQQEKGIDETPTSYKPVDPPTSTSNSPHEDERISRISAGHSSTHRPTQETYSAMNKHLPSSHTPPSMCLPISHSQEDLETYAQASPNDNSASVFSKSFSRRYSPSSTNGRFEADSSQSPQRNVGDRFDNPRHYPNERPPSITSEENSISNLLSSNTEPGDDNNSRFFPERESEECY